MIEKRITPAAFTASQSQLCGLAGRSIVKIRINLQELVKAEAVIFPDDSIIII